MKSGAWESEPHMNSDLVLRLLAGILEALRKRELIKSAGVISHKEAMRTEYENVRKTKAIYKSET